MEELLDIFAEAYKERQKDIKKNFRKASELGLRQGDVIFYRDGEVTCVNDADELMCRFKNIVEVRRATDWKNVEIIKPKRRTRKGDK